MSIKPSEFSAAIDSRLSSAEHAVSSLEKTHNWEIELQKHFAYRSGWGQGSYSWGLDIYGVDSSGNDITWSWGGAYASTKILLGGGDHHVYGNLGSDKVHTGAGDDIFIVTQASPLDNADVIRDFGKGKDRIDFGDNVSTVYVRQVNGDTILQNSDADDAEVYAVLKGYTGTLDDIESTYDAAVDFTFVDIL
jgi:hypothetical protein